MTATIAKTEKGRLVNRGMGGFLNPPMHPEHNWSVEIDLHRRPENRGSMSLSAAAECDYLDPDTVYAAKAKLENWKTYRYNLDNPEVQDWIKQVLGYFKGCYRNPAAGYKEFYASEVIIDRDRNPLDKPEDHAGVNLIRRYYPEYVPTAEDFEKAYWGTKPEAK